MTRICSMMAWVTHYALLDHAAAGQDHLGRIAIWMNIKLSIDEDVLILMSEITVLGYDNLRQGCFQSILQTLWAQEGPISTGLQMIERVAEEHVATDVELDIIWDQSIVVMTRDCWRLFSGLEEMVMFHAYDESYTANNLDDEVRRHLLHAAHALMATRSSGGGLFRSLDSVMGACNPWRFIRDGAPWFAGRSDDLLQDFAEVHTVAKRLLTVLSNVKDVRASWDEDRGGT